ncbi:MAG TPA: alpha-hydroxy acid oxidase [Candidatus Binataceae bacterium]|nr:alpha-hydroxy acid oxidase [Candidatus Binataceae bacterium]
MRVQDAVNIDDLRRLARRRLPRVAFDFIEGGVEDEHCLAANESSFARHRLVPRYMVDISRRDQSAALFGHDYASPFGIAPTGLAALFRADADLILARAAAAANIPFIMSGASTASIEAAAQVAPAQTWYQLYAARDRKISEDMIRRASDAGLGTLVLTVDVPVPSKRERNARNGFELPLKLKWSKSLEALMHPLWIAGYLRRGIPRFDNWAFYAEPGASAKAIAAFVARQLPCSVTWRDLENFRRLWPRHLVVKGIMHPDDAVRATQIGIDGIIVSNHGGRQLDQAPAPLDMLPAICAAVADKVTVMLDSGVRRGADILTALCLGARFVFVGRATLYGAAAGGLPGVRKAIDILRKEIDLVMGQIGCPRLDGLGPGFLLQPAAPPMRTEIHAEPDGAPGLEERRPAEKVARR